MEIDTGLEVKVPSGYCLKFDLVPTMTNQGLVLLSQEGVTEGEVRLTIMNASRNILVLSPGSPLAKVRLEKVTKLEWEVV